MAWPYGPYRRGEIVWTWGGKPSGILYGIITKAGAKVYEVLWESDSRARYRQDHQVIRHAGPRDFADDTSFEAEIKTKLTKAAKGVGV